MSARKGGALGPALPAGVPSRHPVHPGRMLERLVLQPLSLSQSETARQLGISRRRVNELVQGQRAMSPDTAIRCALPPLAQPAPGEPACGGAGLGSPLGSSPARLNLPFLLETISHDGHRSPKCL